MRPTRRLTNGEAGRAELVEDDEKLPRKVAPPDPQPCRRSASPETRRDASPPEPQQPPHELAGAALALALSTSRWDLRRESWVQLRFEETVRSEEESGMRRERRLGGENEGMDGSGLNQIE
jgi:hypothetical protein